MCLAEYSGKLYTYPVMQGLVDSQVNSTVSTKAVPITGGRTLGTATSVGGAGATVWFSVFYPNPLKYTDPDGRSDFSGNRQEYLKNEPQVKAFLENVKKSPGDYKISAFQRRAMDEGKRTELMTHSFYVITDKEDKIYTLSFNGTKEWVTSEGAWAINTDSDVNSYESFKNGSNNWDMVELEFSNGINTEQTVSEIIKKIDSDLTYYYKDHVTNKPNADNCNNALYETLVPQW
jgi:hypothetical protein